MNLQAGVLSLVVCAGSAFAAPMAWLTAHFGYWGEGANWDTGMFPTLEDDAVLGHAGFYSVYVTGQQAGGSVSMTNPDARLEILAGSSLDLYGDLFADGSVVVNPKGLDESGVLRFMADATLGGSGGVRLVPNGLGSTMIEVADGATLTLGESQRITGGGRIVGDVDLRGTVIADDRPMGIQFADGLVDLHGSLIAGFGSSIALDQVQFTMHDGAEIVLGGEDAELVLSSSTLHNFHLEMGEGTLLHLPATGRPSSQDDVEFIDSVVTGRIEILNHEDLKFTSTRFVDADILMLEPMESRGSLTLGSGVEFEGQGTIRIESDDPSSVTLNTLGAVTVGEYVIEGYGRVGLSLSQSEIRGDTSGKTLNLIFYTLRTNSGVIRAVNGGTVYLERGSGSLYQKNGGEIVAEGEGSVVEIDGTIENGVIRSIDGGKIMALDDAWFQDVIVEGDLYATDREVRIVDAMTNNGRIMGDLRSTFALTLGGEGEVELFGEVSDIGSQGEFPGLFTHLDGHTISGAGVIRSQLVNHGVIRADVFQESLDFEQRGRSDDVIENHGSLIAVGGATLGIRQNVVQGPNGVLRAAGPGSRVELGSPNPGFYRELIGGRILTSTGGQVRITTDYVFDHVDVDGHVVVEADHSLELGEGVRVTGMIELDGGEPGDFTTLTVEGPNLATMEGTIRLGIPWQRVFLRGANDEFLVGPGARLEGGGQNGDALRVQGTLAPGVGVGDFFSRMALFLEGPNAVLEIEVGPDSNDLLLLGRRKAELNGTLDVRFVDGFAPTGFWSRVIIVEMSSADDFGMREIAIAPPPVGYVTRVYYTNDTLLLGQTCVADINLDGEVDFFDVAEFVRLYQDGWSGVDLNDDGVLNFFDVTAFIVGYQQGCP